MVALSLMTSVLLARFLGPDGRGLLLALTFWPGFLSGIFRLSVNEALVYHTAKVSDEETAVRQRRFATAGFAIQSVIAVLTTLATVLIMQWVLPGDRQAHLSTVLWYAAVFTPLSVLDVHFKSVLQGRGDFKALNTVRLCQPVGYVVALLVLVFLNQLNVEAVMIAIVCALSFSLTVSWVFAGLNLETPNEGASTELLKSGWVFHKANLVLYAAAEADKLIVLSLMDDTRTGFYAVALAISLVGSGLVVQSLGLVLARQMAGSPTIDTQRAVFLRNFHTAFILLLGLNGLAALITPTLLPILFGSAFGPAVSTAIILLAMGVFLGLRQISDRAMRATHNTRIGITGEALAIAGILLFATTGASLGGLEGLAAGLVLAQLTALVVVIVMVSRTLHFSLFELWPFRRDVIVWLYSIVRDEVVAGWSRLR
ncbi:MAG: oligosaccharide flippase family protein [Pseudomonadota bacterium]